MFGKNAVTPQIESAVAKAVNFEVTISDIARRSERRAWMVAWSAILMSLVLAGGYFYFLPLKEKVPYLVMADAYTGTSTIARLTGDFGDQRITTSEALNKSNITHFIMARESYDYSQIGQRDWSTVHAMAAPEVTSGYTHLYSSTNPNNPITRFKKSKAVRVKILSLQLHGDQNTTSQVKTATVRFQRSLYDKASGASEHLDSKIATLEFLYRSNLKMADANRVLNPLGFYVTGYRVDNDYAAAPPAEIEFPTAPAPGTDMQGIPAAGAAEIAPDSVLPPGNSVSVNAVTSTSPTATPTPASPHTANGVNTR